MSKIFQLLNIFKLATPILTPIFKWVFPNNNFHPVRAAFVLIGFIIMLLSVHFIGVEETKQAAEITEEYVIPAIGKFDAELQAYDAGTVNGDSEQQETTAFTRDSRR